jgi:transposase-like protein
MAQAALPLTALSEAQRTQALERLEIIRPALEKHVSQAQVARTHQLPPSTVQLWIKRYREKGLAGLANATRSDKGKSRSLPEQAITLVEGLALQTPPRSAAAIHRQVAEIAKEQGWPVSAILTKRSVVPETIAQDQPLTLSGPANRFSGSLYRRLKTVSHRSIPLRSMSTQSVVTWYD